MNRGDRCEPIFKDESDRQRFVETMLAQKQVTSRIHGRAYRNRPLSDEQKESNRQKCRIRARIEHVVGFMSQSMKGFYLCYSGGRRNVAAIGLITLIDNLARSEQIVWLKLLEPPPEPREKPETTDNQSTTKVRVRIIPPKEPL